MSRTTQLFELQQVDSQLDERLVRVQAVNASLGEGPVLLAARAERDTAKAELDERHARLREISGEVEDLTQRIDMMSKRLFGGSIKNPKELGQIQHDIESAKVVRSTHEDQLLVAMELVEESEKVYEAKQSAYEETEAEWRRSQAGLLEEKDRLDEQLRAIHTHRQKMVADVPWADLQLYERLRKAKRGVAVAALVHDVCQGCRVQVPGSILRQARLGQEIVLCASCGRILHSGGRGETVNVK